MKLEIYSHFIVEYVDHDELLDYMILDNDFSLRLEFHNLIAKYRGLHFDVNEYSGEFLAEITPPSGVLYDIENEDPDAESFYVYGSCSNSISAWPSLAERIAAERPEVCEYWRSVGMTACDHILKATQEYQLYRESRGNHN